ncbi:hypothetical protein ACRAWC_25740 [Leifsonia sp. L25]|uniref:hypothetical protein n=1 Tax=Leifsonia sp. L25 TaxID=3423957 RepID=UPI003D699182
MSASQMASAGASASARASVRTNRSAGCSEAAASRASASSTYREQFVQLAHQREDGEHGTLRLASVVPRGAGEGVLRDLLPGTEAVEDGAALEAALAQFGMDAAAGSPRRG